MFFILLFGSAIFLYRSDESVSVFSLFTFLLLPFTYYFLFVMLLFTFRHFSWSSPYCTSSREKVTDACLRIACLLMSFYLCSCAERLRSRMDRSMMEYDRMGNSQQGPLASEPQLANHRAPSHQECTGSRDRCALSVRTSMSAVLEIYVGINLWLITQNVCLSVIKIF